MKTLAKLLFPLVLTFAACNLEPAPPIIPSNTEESSPESPYTPVEPILPPITNPEEPIEQPIEEPEPIPRGDLLVSIYTDNYQVGDVFNYSGRIQSSRVEQILIEDGNIEWRLIRQEKIEQSDIAKDLEIILNQQGFIEMVYLRKEQANFP